MFSTDKQYYIADNNGYTACICDEKLTRYMSYFKEQELYVFECIKCATLTGISPNRISRVIPLEEALVYDNQGFRVLFSLL